MNKHLRLILEGFLALSFGIVISLAAALAIFALALALSIPPSLFSEEIRVFCTLAWISSSLLYFLYRIRRFKVK